MVAMEGSRMKVPKQELPVLKQELAVSEQVQKIRSTQKARVESWLRTGDSLMWRGEWQEALDEYKKVALHSEWNLQNWKWKPKGSKEDLPALPYAWERIAEAHGKLGNETAEKRARAKAGELRGELDAFIEAFKVGDNKELSMEFLRGAMLINRKSSISMLQFAQDLEKGGDLEGALKRLDELLKRDKDCAEALEMKIEICGRLGDANAERDARQKLANLLRKEEWKPIEVGEELD